MKRNIFISILGLSLILLSACGTANKNEIISLKTEPIVQSEAQNNAANKTNQSEPALDGFQNNETPAVPENSSENITKKPETNAPASNSAAEAQPSTANDPSGIYRDIYIQIINQSPDNTTAFSLIYLNDDDIPELVIHDRNYDSYSIYTIKNGESFCMADSMVTVEMTYFERRSLISEFARWNGGGDEGGYGKYYYQLSTDKTLTNEAQPILNDSYNAVYNEEGVYTGEGVTSYYNMGVETDEESYRKIQADLGITENGDKPCLEVSYEKGDILSYLSQ